MKKKKWPGIINACKESPDEPSGEFGKETIARVRKQMGQKGKQPVDGDLYVPENSALLKPSQKPGMFQPSFGAKLFGILLGTALAFVIFVLICSCAKDDNPYNNIDAQLLSIHDQFILDSLRQEEYVVLDSARVRYIELISGDSASEYYREINITLHDDSIGMGTLGFAIIKKVPPDSVLLVRSNGIVWAFWCKNW